MRVPLNGTGDQLIAFSVEGSTAENPYTSDAKNAFPSETVTSIGVPHPGHDAVTLIMLVVVVEGLQSVVVVVVVLDDDLIDVVVVVGRTVVVVGNLLMW